MPPLISQMYPLLITRNAQKLCEKIYMENTSKFLMFFFFTTLFIFDLRTFVANLALTQLRAVWGGTFGQNLVGGGMKTF